MVRRVAAAVVALALTPLASCAGLGSAGRPSGSERSMGSLTPAPPAAAAPRFSQPPASSPSSRDAFAQTTHEVPTPVPRERTDVTSRSALDAVRAFALSYINWQAGTLAAQLTLLARESIGQARSAMELQAAQSSGDSELKGGGIANHGTVEAVGPLAESSDRFVVVTQERTTARLPSAYAGLRPAWHVTVATASQVTPGAWVISGWQPKS